MSDFENCSLCGHFPLESWHICRNWMDIETAPEEPGTAMLTWHPEEGTNVLWRGRGGAWLSNVYDYVEAPTHWMPLPTPPKTDNTPPAPEGNEK